MKNIEIIVSIAIVLAMIGIGAVDLVIGNFFEGLILISLSKVFLNSQVDTLLKEQENKR